MSAQFRNPTVALKNSTLHVHSEIANNTAEPWRSSQGWAAGYQLFDEPTGTLVVDGARTPLNLAPAQSAVLNLEIDLPPEPGDYNVFVSPVRENVAWFHEQGWPFLLVDIAVGEGGAARIKGWRITGRGAFSRRKFRRSLGRAFTLPLRAIVRNQTLIRTLVRRDILSRYTGSFAGNLWTVLNPLLLMLTYFLIFGVIMGQRAPGDPSRAGFALYYLAGFLPWLAFSEALGRAPNVLIEHRNFIRKLVFPVEILPINLAASGLVTEFFGVILFALALLLIHGRVPETAVWLPVILIPQILLTIGLSWFLAALGVFLRDLAQINGFLLTIWFFITPICYPENALTATLPAKAVRMLAMNPVFILVRAYRSIFLESHAPDLKALGSLTLIAAAIFFLGHAWFYKLRRSFADLI